MAAAPMTLTLQLRPLREAKGWSQAELARRSGVPQSSISRLEAGETASIAFAHLEKLADALDVNAGALLLHVPKGRRP